MCVVHVRALSASKSAPNPTVVGPSAAGPLTRTEGSAPLITIAAPEHAGGRNGTLPLATPVIATAAKWMDAQMDGWINIGLNHGS